MEKYYFILHSEEKGTWLLQISFPTGDYISSFVSELKQDGIRIYDYFEQAIGLSQCFCTGDGRYGQFVYFKIPAGFPGFFFTHADA